MGCPSLAGFCVMFFAALVVKSNVQMSGAQPPRYRFHVRLSTDDGMNAMVLASGLNDANSPYGIGSATGRPPSFETLKSLLYRPVSLARFDAINSDLPSGY